MAEPTQVQKVTAAWAKLKIAANLTLPVQLGRMKKVRDQLR